MNKSSKNNQKGFVELIVVVIVALVILHLLGIDLTQLLAKQWVRDFAIYVRDMIRLVWADLLEIFGFVKSVAN
ncbi:MAG: hypothetical protein RL094_487 [Candidatus Parcubacteria bacterium]|jgi:hypothetical protein